MKKLFNGEQVEAIEVEILTEHEPWNEYQLADGNILKVKNILKEVYKIKDKLGPDGAPIYGLESQVIVTLKQPGPK